MKIAYDFSRFECEWGVVPYMNQDLLLHNDEDSDCVLFNGAAALYDKPFREEYRDYRRRCLLALWSPCEMIEEPNKYHFDSFEFFTDVYCVCPFTCHFMNQFFKENKFKYIPYPFTNHTITHDGVYDSLVSWFGGCHGEDHQKGIDTIRNHSHKYITSRRNVGPLGMNYREREYPTHVDISTEDKLIEVSRCRSSLTFNKLYLGDAWGTISHCRNEGSFLDGNLYNKAFDHFDEKIMPQFKVRTHEIASCKSLILAHKDPWNLIEDFYTADEDFIYFDNFEELDSILKEMEKDPLLYADVAENGFHKSQMYSVDKIYEYIRTEDESLITWSLDNVR
jgi:hypothetical protein